MINVLNGEFYKLRKGKSIYVCIAAVFLLVSFLYATLVMLDNFKLQEVAESGASYEARRMIEEIGIIGVIQEAFNGHFVGFVTAVFASIFVIREFSEGAVKNIVGKGRARAAIFFCKLLATEAAAIVIHVASFAICIGIGAAVIGDQGLASVDWKELGIYMGMQLLFGISITGLVVLVGEVSRNLAVGISVSIGILLFSGSLAEGLDLMLRGLGAEPSKYWVLSVQMECPVVGFGQEFIFRGIAVALVWLVLVAALGAWHFQKADVK